MKYHCSKCMKKISFRETIILRDKFICSICSTELRIYEFLPFARWMKKIERNKPSKAFWKVLFFLGLFLSLFLCGFSWYISMKGTY